MGLVCIQNLSLLVYSKSKKVSVSCCLPFQHSRGKGFCPLPSPGLFRVKLSKTLVIDDGKEFYGDTTKLMEKHDVMIQRGDQSQHLLQGIVERFIRSLADRLFSYQYHKELEDPLKSKREWVSRLQNVVSTLNNEKTTLIGMKNVDVIEQTW